MVDINTHFYFICQLVRNVSKSPSLVKKFSSKYDNLGYIDLYSSDRSLNRIIKESRQWYNSPDCKVQYQLVTPIFRLLGATSIMEEYQKEQRYLLRQASQKELGYIKLLFDCFETVFPFNAYEERPEVRVNCSGKLYDKIELKERNITKDSYKRYRLKIIVVESVLFRLDFNMAFLEFSEQLLNIYGTESCKYNNLMMTYLGEAIIHSRQTINLYRKRWVHKCSE